MSTETPIQTPSSLVDVPVEAPPSPPEQLVSDRLHTARRQIWVLDLVSGLLTFLGAIVVYLLGVALVDHWLLANGLGFWGRLLALAGLLALLGGLIARVVVPAVRYRISPLYAAQLIERSEPRFKNSLINFLLLRGDRKRVAPAVFSGVERRAAGDISRIELEASIDRSRAFRLSYLVLVLLGLFVVYLMISPKNPFTSAARVLWPWADIAAPTRVEIAEVQPGDVTAYQGDQITVSAVVRGLREDEPVRLLYSTADGQLVDQVIPMTRPDGAYRFTAELPPGKRGMQQDHLYRIAAGDRTTPAFHASVEIPPTLLVESLRLDYPDYTGLPNRVLENQGDVRALEGTRVVIHARANRPMRRAEIDLGCDGLGNNEMSIKDEHAVGQFKLRMRPDAPGQAMHDCYQLRVVDKDGRANPRPIRHRIEVIADLPPEITLVEPSNPRIDLPADAPLRIRLRAEDPDFALRTVRLRAMVDNRPLKLQPLLNRSPAQSAHQGAFKGEVVFRPWEWELQPGDRVRYWAEAEDNRQPEPGLGKTSERWINIIEPAGGGDQQRRGPGAPGADRLPRDGQQSGDVQPNDRQPRDGQGVDQPRAPRQQPEQEPGQQPANPDEPRGDAPDQSQDSADGQSAEGQSPNGEPSAAGNQPPGEGQPRDEQPGDRQPGDRQSGEQQGANQGQQQGEQQQDTQPGENQSGQDQQGQNQPGQAESGQNGQGQIGGQGEPGQPGQSPQQQRRVDPDTNPGDAIERILQHRRENGRQDQQQPGQQQPGQQGNQPANQPDQGQSQPRDGQNANGQQPSGGQNSNEQPRQGQTGGEGGGQRQQPSEGQQPDQPPSTDPSGGASGQDQPGGQNQPGGQDQPGAGEAQPGQAPQQPGQSAPPGADDRQPRPGATGGERTGRPGTGEGERQPGETSGQGARPDSSGGEAGRRTEQQDQPPSGDPSGSDRRPGGQQGEQMPGQTPGAGGGQPNQGSPAAQEDNLDRPKQTGQPGSEQSPGQDPAQSPGTSRHQSDSQGETAGDRSGGGEQGGGQRAPRQGQGTPGSQTPSDAGNPGAAQPGGGETGTRGGQGAESDRPTGTQVRRPGQGQTRPGGRPTQGASPDGAQPSGRQGQGGQPGGNQPGGGDQPVHPGRQPGSRGSGTVPAGGGQGPRGRGAASGDQAGSEPGAADPNLEYAREQTDLALQHLDDQLGEGDEELLDRLGWTREEARRFLDQWKQLRRTAGRDDAQGAAARESLDRALRSLGLRRGGTQLDRGTTPVDRLNSVREGLRSRPPAGWAEQFDAYTRGVAEGDQQR